MNVQSNLAALTEVPALAAEPRQRRCYRHKLQTLAYVNLDDANGGIVRDLSEAGLAVQVVAPLRVHQQVRLRFDLLKPRIRVETTGQVVWADRLGQAGLRFLDLPPRQQRLLREWLFTNLMSGATQVSWDSIFGQEPRDGEADGLVFSPSARPPIPLEAAVEVAEGAPVGLKFSWWPAAVSARTLARVVDVLVLLLAVLLFSLIFLATAHALPSGLVALGLAVGIPVFLVVLYWCLFVVWGAGTPGGHLARMAGCEKDKSLAAEEETPRFR